MSTLFKSKEFIELKKLWDQKLSDLGLGEPEFRGRRSFTEIEADAKRAYYGIAQEFLVTHEFENPLEKEIWRLHCEGMGYKRIASHLKLTGYRVESTYKKFQIMLHLRKR